MARFPSFKRGGRPRYSLPEELRSGLALKGVLRFELVLTVLLWAALHPPSRTEAYLPGTLEWKGIDRFA